MVGQASIGQKFFERLIGGESTGHALCGNSPKAVVGERDGISGSPLDDRQGSIQRSRRNIKSMGGQRAMGLSG